MPIRLICSTDGPLCLRSATTSFWHNRCRRGPSTPTPEAFERNGIKYITSERDRSAIYRDLLPLFSSNRVRLLDDKKLFAQFSSLERKILPSGKDSIIPGPLHDDLANSAAITLTLCAADTAPVLIKYESLLVPTPAGNLGTVGNIPRHYLHFVTGAVQKDGKCAILQWAFWQERLILADFDVGFFNDPKFAAYRKPLGECYNLSAPNRSIAFIGNEPIIVKDFGFVGEAAGPVQAGLVKIATAAHNKSATAPLGDALDFRLDRLHEPLPAAVVTGIAAKYLNLDNYQNHAA